jgi:hypothetical protein
VPSAWPPSAWPPLAWAGLIVVWTLAVHGAFLATSPLRTTPVSAFLFGDSLHFLAGARHLAEGLPPLDEGLPFHPPLTLWLLTPLYWVLGDPAAVHVAAKILMAGLSGASYGLFYLLVRERLPGALPLCLAMPLCFGEIVLTSAVSSEVVYRLLLLAILAVGLRWPLLAGLLHGLAALTRAEHLAFAVCLALAALFVPRWRRFAAWAAAGMAVVVVPYVAVAAVHIRAYDRLHAAELPEPLPVWVPISYYGPLNFALAQREEEIYFSRRTLPPPPSGDLTALDCRFAPHNEAVVHGYRLGFEAIAAAPGRFLSRTAAKVAYSLKALAYGWTWRDLPKPGHWVRQAVDAAYSPSRPYELLCWLLVAAGAWSLRRQPQLLAVGFVLVAYRLAVNAVFFPYLRGMMVVSPFYLALLWSGWRPFLGRFWGRAVAAALLLLSLYHFSTIWGERPYSLSGERTADGRIIDDRRVVIELDHPAP